MKKIVVLMFAGTFLVGCSFFFPKAKVVYFNDSDKISSDTAKNGVCTAVAFDCVVMSTGKFRDITGITPQTGKIFKVTYE